ncbi:hypothetical protein AYL99_00516 [Fonsecaea erecta]|uniref:Uncharacterized protein n=1 Tax=Fonsecaea erecta TaxID=1367422 RepID=A0A178ZXN0_9EURO|nr:hypothetical protein AYL99_00516 [Fonsecaea erecta]OAP64544.1 hypothetical protein AYL99_00516 [Fonsecaea erecta]
MSLLKKDLIRLIDQIADNWGSIRNKLSKQNAGGRLSPSQTPKKDEKTKGRAHQGEKLPKNEKKDEDEPHDTYNVNIQANNQGPASHKKLFTVQVAPSATNEDFRARMRNAAQDKGII